VLAKVTKGVTVCVAVPHLPLAIAADGSAHGVVFLNSHGMDVVLNSSSVTYK
jgi:hypothetical protein